MQPAGVAVDEASSLLSAHEQEEALIDTSGGSSNGNSPCARSYHLQQAKHVAC